MCGVPRPFFPEGDDLTDEVVDTAYWLAHVYHQSPDVFLACTIDELAEHVERTTRVLKIVNGR